ncbi:uncharacterized protein LOC134246608 isoform X1 [Saccostrea cucullata]|uniref:uncharacterized protein LOC134246608 isoform X1 n=1 Tax=Saccostrea cuccullata TaxID=36930 RepID=UPI002ED5C1BC
MTKGLLIILTTASWINYCICQRLHPNSVTCSEPDELNFLKAELSDVQQLVRRQSIKMELLEEELNYVKKKLYKTMPDHVAFHAIASSRCRPGVIFFDHLITNIGFGYDKYSGIFTVPTTGFYVFSWSIETYGQLTEAALLVNGFKMGISKSDEASTYYDTSTSFAVLNLTVDDEVWIKLKSGSAQGKHTMFSGWMINKSDSTAFYASLSRDVAGSPIIFNKEILDTDDAYSTTTGKFVAPRSGLYVFMMSGLIYGSDDFTCRFVFSNGISQPNVWVDSSSGRYDSSSFMTFAWMNSGDSVYINAERMSATSMFAGWLLSDDTNVSKPTYPAFLAHIGKDSSRTPVVYDKAFGGYLHGYSTTSGVFTADRDGLYLFLYNTEAYKEIVRTAITVNGVEKFETRSDGRRTEYDDTSAVTLLQLFSNDRVYIEIKNGAVDENQSLYFGILLFEM